MLGRPRETKHDGRLSGRKIRLARKVIALGKKRGAQLSGGKTVDGICRHVIMGQRICAVDELAKKGR